MVRPKNLAPVYSVLSMALIVAIACSFFALTGTQAHGSQASASQSTPRYFQFHHNYAAKQFSGLSGGALATWSSTFSAEGKTWSYTMVGSDPSKGSATTTVPVTIVPLLLNFTGGVSFDGTSRVAGTTSSPLFKNAKFNSGTTQFGDAVARAEFWKSVSTVSPNYHALVGTPTIATTLSINVPAADGAVTVDPSSGKAIGLIDINWFDPMLQTLLTSYAPNMLPFFLSNNVYLTSGTPVLTNCCIGGYHNAVPTSKGMQSYLYTTEADAGVQGGFSEDVSAASHELLEWFNDPYTTNVVPNWISPIAPQYGCNNALEVGDPLVGVLFTVKGFSADHLQDEAFFNWFARESPSTALHGRYTYLGKFKKLSKMC